MFIHYFVFDWSSFFFSHWMNWTLLELFCFFRFWCAMCVDRVYVCVYVWFSDDDFFLLYYYFVWNNSILVGEIISFFLSIYLIKTPLMWYERKPVANDRTELKTMDDSPLFIDLFCLCVYCRNMMKKHILPWTFFFCVCVNFTSLPPIRSKCRNGRVAKTNATYSHNFRIQSHSVSADRTYLFNFVGLCCLHHPYKLIIAPR